MGGSLSPSGRADALDLGTRATLVVPTGRYPVLSAWVIDGKCEGFIMREGEHPVTYDETSVPVVVTEAPLP